MADRLKLGMVGLDISHCTAFTQILHDSGFEHHVPGAEVTSAYPGGSPRFSRSRDRVGSFTEEMTKRYGVSIVETIGELADRVDAVLLESVDGRQHLEQFEQLAVGKPVFIEKPLTCSTAEARRIIEIAEATGTPLVSCSAIRYARGIADLIEPGKAVHGCEAYGPAPLLDDYPGLFWYGVHSAEVLFLFMGAGCRRVRCLEHPSTDIVLGEWTDGRPGAIRGTRLEDPVFGCVVHTSEAVYHGQSSGNLPAYHAMLQDLVEFFGTGVPPIDAEETFQIIAFLEAAERSRKLNGRPVDLESL